MWKCIGFLRKWISSQPATITRDENPESILFCNIWFEFQLSWKSENLYLRINKRHCWCSIQSFIRCLTKIKDLYLILVDKKKKEKGIVLVWWCVMVCYAQWAECLPLHDWYQDNRPEYEWGNAFSSFQWSLS